MKWPRFSRLLTLALALLAVPAVQAQAPAVLIVETNLPEAVVFADSVRLGPAVQGAFAVPASAGVLRLVPPGGDAWSIVPVERAFEVGSGDTLVLAMPFAYHYRIESLPFGATVTHLTPDGRVALGETPLLHRSEAPLGGALVVERAGYAAVELVPGADVWNRHVVTLAPISPHAAASAEVSWQPPRRSRRWIDYAAGAAAVGAGVVAIYYKFEADAIDDRYRQTGDPTLRDEVKALDTRSVVALGVMQAGIGVLAVRFILR